MLSSVHLERYVHYTKSCWLTLNGCSVSMWSVKQVWLLTLIIKIPTISSWHDFHEAGCCTGAGHLQVLYIFSSIQPAANCRFVGLSLVACLDCSSFHYQWLLLWNMMDYILALNDKYVYHTILQYNIQFHPVSYNFFIVCLGMHKSWSVLTKYNLLHIVFQILGGMIFQSPHSKQDLGLNPLTRQMFACSLHVCVGFLWVLPLKVQRHAVNWWL